jgi:hypothetical protein
MKKEPLAVVSLYTLLTLFLTYPLVFSLRTHVPGWGDVWQNLWLLWHTKLAFVDPVESIYYTNYLFYPTGTPLIPMSLYNQLLSVPLQYVFPLNVTYNLLFLSSFVIAGTTTFYLVKHLTGDKHAAFVGGVVYAFAPYTLSQGIQGHMEAFTTGWIPLYVLFLFKFIEEKQSLKEEAKSAALAAVGLILVAASDLVYMMFTIIFTGIFLVYWLITTKSKRLVLRFALFCSLFLLAAIPITYPIVGVALSEDNFLKPLPSDYVRLSADFMSFFIPLDSHPILGSHTKPFFDLIGNVRDGWARWENNLFTGYTVLALLTYAFFRVKGKNAGFWKISFLLTLLLSLGPFLNVAERTSFSGMQIPLPYLLLYHTVPFLHNARTIARMDILVMLSAAVLAGYAVSHLSNNWSLDRKKSFALALSTGILLEFLVVPFPLSKAGAPEFYGNFSEDDAEYAIAEVPVLSNYGCNVRAMYYQTLNGRKITGGRLARQPPYVYQLTLDTPLLRELEYYGDQPYDIDIFVGENRTEKSLSILNYYNIRYIVVNADCIGRENLSKAEQALSRAGAWRITQTENQTVYRMPEIAPGFFVTVKRGWHDVEYWNNHTPARWTTGNATVLIYSPQPQNTTFHFTTASYHEPRTNS